MMNFTVMGKMSTFGGPSDTGVSGNEGLVLFSSEAQMRECGLGDYLLTEQEAKASGLARRLNPKKYYLACRWPADTQTYSYLRSHSATVRANEKTVQARPVDWGPSTSTRRVADLSPGLAEALGLQTDGICSVTIGEEVEEESLLSVAGSDTRLAETPGFGDLRTPNGRVEIEQIFGSPANADGTLNEHWEEQNIRAVPPPSGWQLYYEDDHQGVVPVSGIRMHRLLEPSFRTTLTQIWEYARQQLGGSASLADVRSWLHERRLDQHGGGFNFRNIRGTSHLSLHSYGIAIDWDPDHNPQGRSASTLPNWWYDIWAKNGWTDGRHFSNPDPMHVQFARGA
jgi:hypothetical protein